MLGIVIDRDDVRVIELGYDTGFALEARQEVGVFEECRVHDLDRDIPVQGCVVGFVHCRHTALAEFVHDAIGAYVLAVGKGHSYLPSRRKVSLLDNHIIGSWTMDAAFCRRSLWGVPSRARSDCLTTSIVPARD